jgi:uncharacterized protein YjbI with pentapeptide repeats
MIKYDIKNKYTSTVMFTAEIDCDESSKDPYKKRLAVLWALENNIDLINADLSWADLSKANLSEANLSWADLRWADLSWADLSKANLSWADLSKANLSEANLSKANLSDANLRDANLSKANLSKANLRDANLSWADLRNANLSWADLSWADLSKANLSEANLSWADLRNANLSWADLSEANANNIKLGLYNERLYKHDFWGILMRFKKEIPGLVDGIKKGEIDGSCYSGKCCCLMGTIANVKGCDVDDDQFNIKLSNSPIEQWFTLIKPSDTHENNFASKKALEWIEEFVSLQ